jgi:hypothetical protein
VKKPQMLDLDPVALIDGCIGCTRSCVAHDTFPIDNDLNL